MPSPIKTDAHLIGVRGERHLLSAIPETWGYMKHDTDLGIDVMFEIWSPGPSPQLVGRDVAIQIKSHENLPLDRFTRTKRPASYKSIRAQVPFERLQRSTVEYLSTSNAFVASIYLGNKGLRAQYETFLAVLPGMLRNWRFQPGNDDPAICITPLRPIAADLLALHPGSKEVRIPVHPLNFCTFIHSHYRDSYGHAALRRPQDGAPAYDTGLSSDTGIILHDSWQELLVDSLQNDVFDQIFAIRYAPFVKADPTAFIADLSAQLLAQAPLTPSLIWRLFECVVAGFFFKLEATDWLDPILAMRSEFFSLIILRLFRHQARPMSPGLFATYCEGSTSWPSAPAATDPFLADPFRCLGGKSGMREFYDEGCGYLDDLMRVDPDLARRTIRHLLTKDQRFGANELFGQMASSWMETKLPELVIDIVRNDLGEDWAHHDNRLIEMVRAVDVLDVKCLDFSPRDW
jgi:hypothetical protein